MNDTLEKDNSGGNVKKKIPRKASNADIWARVGLLFGVLCLIKILILVTFRKYLYEIHWPVNPMPPTLFSKITFYVFAALVGLNLFALAMRCRKLEARTIRMVNGCVLALGAVFIFLSFHVMDKNYLWSVMNGVLTWKNLGSYFSMNFFFAQPYLVVWALVYMFIYYILSRTGRENKILLVTAAFAAIYTAFYLKDLASSHHALIVADIIGLISLLVGFRSNQRPLASFWLGLFFVLVISFFALFHSLGENLRHLIPEFIVLSFGGIILFAGASLLIWQRGGYGAWSWALPFAFSAFLLLTNVNYILAVNYNDLFCLGITLPRYFLGEFALAALLLAIAFTYKQLLPKSSLWWLDAINMIIIILALADVRLSQIMGVRLDWQVLEFGDSPKMMWRLAKPYLPQFFGVFVVLIVVYFISLFALCKWSKKLVRNQDMPSNGSWFALLAFLGLGLAGWSFANQDKVEGQTVALLVETNPIWHNVQNPPLTREQFTGTARQLGIHVLATSPTALRPADKPRDLNVVLIFQESSYNKYLSLFDGKTNTEPLLSKYKDRMELFPNFFSNFEASIYARFASFTGLYPSIDFASFTLKRVPVKSIFEILHDQGYSCSLFYSSYVDYTGFRDFLSGRGLDEMYDADTMPVPHTMPPVVWGLREEETLAAMQNQIKKYAANKKKFFLTYIPAAPHNPFDVTPDRFRKYKIKEMGDFTPLYLNTLDYMDWIISSVIDQLKDSGLLGNTLVIITADHGEMLGQNGGPTGHGWAVTPELANVPLIIMDPARPGYSVNPVVGSQVDLLPTLLDRLNIPLPGGQLYEGTSLDSSIQNRFIYLNAFQQYGLIYGKQITCADRVIGTQEEMRMSGKNYILSNQGARTFFTPANAPYFSLPSISEFDNFQENLLAHYAHYCQLFQTVTAAQN
ncbi:MAG TPA: sulfatase-like hydrolase/transferase [Verrucomicrobiae bacterium]|nr:sulfatase-like hydrolase/transferase [Verrucomicrobiae bacterium]